MNSTQSIIVYRNPLEQAFWETFMGSPLILPIFASGSAFILSIVILEKIVSKFVKRYNRPNYVTNIIMILSLIVAGFTFSYFNNF